MQFGAMKYSRAFAPYRPDGTIFTLSLYEYTGDDQDAEHPYVAYMLQQNQTPIFMGTDFQPSPDRPMYGDRAAHDLLQLLCASTQDTPAEHFEEYTLEQLWFARRHASALWYAVECWYGESHPEDMEEVEVY